MEIITPQARPIDVLITALYKLHILETSEMVDTISNMQLADLNSKPSDGKILKDIINCVIEACLCPPPWPEHYKLLLLDQFHGPSHISDSHKKKNETKFARI